MTQHENHPERPHESETLRQQRKARKEWLALKQMQRDGEIERHSTDTVRRQPQTFGEAVSNFWYYYKKVVIVTALLTAAAIFFTVQCALKPQTDYQVAVFDYRFLIDGYLAQMEDGLALNAPDTNDDGKVVVNLINCTFQEGLSTAEFQQTRLQKLQSLIAVDADTMLFITSADTYTYLHGLTEDGLLGEYHPFTEAFYGTLTAIEESTPPAGLGISVRRVEGTLMASNQKAVKAAENAEALIQALQAAGLIQ